MSTPAKRRIMKDMKRLVEEPLDGIFAVPNKTNIMEWSAIIVGPEETVFEDGTFKVRLSFPETYPLHPPEVSFISRIFHPNIYADGNLCLDILKNRWNPTYDIGVVLLCVQSLLNDPNNTSPANSEAAELFIGNYLEYRRRVRETVEWSWIESREYQKRGRGG